MRGERDAIRGDLLASLELNDTNVYEPSLRACLGSVRRGLREEPVSETHLPLAIL